MKQDDQTFIEAPSSTGWTRRKFLQLGTKSGSLAIMASALISVWPITRYLSSRPSLGPSVLKVKEEAFPPNQWMQIPSSRVWLLKDERGYTALLATCTHLGCEVKLHSDNLWHCPCHGSIYDEEGRPRSGPALKALPRLAMTRDSEDTLTINLNKTVGMDVRIL